MPIIIVVFCCTFPATTMSRRTTAGARAGVTHHAQPTVMLVPVHLFEPDGGLRVIDRVEHILCAGACPKTTLPAHLAETLFGVAPEEDPAAPALELFGRLGGAEL